MNNVVNVLDRVMQPPAGYDPNISNLPDPGANAVHIKPMMGGNMRAGNMRAGNMRAGNMRAGNMRAGNMNDEKATVTILGEPYRVRRSVSLPLEDEELRLLEAFHVTEKDIPSDILFSFFHALTEYNCEKEQGVILNPKCEPVRAILRSVLMKKALNEIDVIRQDENLEPLVKLLKEDILRRRNKLNFSIENLKPLITLLNEDTLRRRNKFDLVIENVEPIMKLLNEDTLRRRNKLNLGIELATLAPPGESIVDNILGGLLRKRYKIPISGIDDEDPIIAGF